MNYTRDSIQTTIDELVLAGNIDAAQLIADLYRTGVEVTHDLMVVERELAAAIEYIDLIDGEEE